MSDETETPLSRECRELRLDNKRLREAAKRALHNLRMSDGSPEHDSIAVREAIAALSDPKGER
jgi:hypothetical protein